MRLKIKYGGIMKDDEKTLASPSVMLYFGSKNGVLVLKN